MLIVCSTKDEIQYAMPPSISFDAITCNMAWMAHDYCLGSCFHDSKWIRRMGLFYCLFVPSRIQIMSIYATKLSNQVRAQRTEWRKTDIKRNRQCFCICEAPFPQRFSVTFISLRYIIYFIHNFGGESEWSVCGRCAFVRPFYVRTSYT